MTWYAAHLLLYVKLKRRRQARYPVWENIVLIRARTEEEAFAKAEEHGRADAAPDDTFTWDGQPAEWVFAGVRKLTLCEDEGERPGDGTEVSYLELEAPSLAAIQKLMDGEPASVKIADGFPEQETVGPVEAMPALLDMRRAR